MTALSDYCQSINAALVTGDATEHTHRSALQDLVKNLAPGLTVLNEPRHIACGAPDLVVRRGNTPVGYIETKDIGQDLSRTERSEQLKRYREALHNLILTDYVEFRLYRGGELAASASLGSLDSGNRLHRTRDGESAVMALFQQFLAAKAPTLGNAKELAEHMAALTRLLCATILKAYEDEEHDPNIEQHFHHEMAIFRRVLIHDLKPETFADMYAQTISYGLFAARCAHHAGTPFDRQSAIFDLPGTNPLLRSLFGRMAGPEIDPRIEWAVNDLAALLDRARMAEILRDFGQRSQREDPVVHFYETFLAAYNPKLREQRGVYYTPEPVVGYIVRSVHALLKGEFGLPMGLADTDTTTYANTNPTVQTAAGKPRKRVESPRVLVLDPACGTGTFLHAVVDEIQDELRSQGLAGAWPAYVADHLLPRLFGFELLMAPYTVAHLKLGLQLAESGYDVQDAHSRLNVYLTNTLEQPGDMEVLPLYGQALAAESREAAGVKSDLPIMVVLGNPPYSGNSANASYREVDGKRQFTPIGKLVHDYYYVDGHPLGERNPKYLQDDYVKFIRWAEDRVERTGAGVVAYITNHGYLDNPTFRGMRQHLMSTFDELYLLDLHGSSKRQEKAPDGGVDENVFDIMPGVTIALMVRRSGPHSVACAVYHADLYGQRQDKYAWLNAHDKNDTPWERLMPQSPFYRFVSVGHSASEYEALPSTTELFGVSVNGFKTHRDDFAIAFQRSDIEGRIRDLRDERLSDEALRTRYKLGTRYDLRSARKAIEANPVWERAVMCCAYRPFDERWCYYSSTVMDRPRRELFDHVVGQRNFCLSISRQQATVGFCHAIISVAPPNDCLISNVSREAGHAFPLYLYPQSDMLPGLEQPTAAPGGRRPNLDEKLIARLSRGLGLSFVPDGHGDLQATYGPEDMLHYIYALLYAPGYRARYADQLKIDFPRIPFTANVALFRTLCGFGDELCALHLLDSPALDTLRTRYPSSDGDNLVDKPRYLPEEDGGKVHINKKQYFEGITEEAWSFYIGGYQPLQKWLKDRQGRNLDYDDILHYQHIVVALEETMRLMAEIDEAIEDAGGWPLK